jgi:predicted amidohydrolase YtcJ
MLTRMRTPAVIVACLASCVAAQTTAYLNANAHTADADRPRVEAFLVEGERFVAAGSNAEIRSHPGFDANDAVDLEGRTVLPGLIDAHGHLIGLGQLRAGVVDLAGTTTYDEVIARVRARAKETPPGQWVLGRGWDNESWPDNALPDHTALSEATPSNPVWLGRVDGHAALANARAMQLAGIDRATPSPDGGEILRGPDGRPTGVFVDNAEALVERVIPEAARGDAETMLLAAQEACLAVGLTGVHDMGISPDVADLLRQMEADGRLKLRVAGALSSWYAIEYFETNPPYAGPRLSVAAAKLYIDGAMGSRGAWLLEPYADRPTDDDGIPYTGLAVAEPDFIEAVAAHALRKHYQVFTHAIGDRANREVLDAYERAATSTGVALAPARFRVEHAQLLHPDDIPRFAELGIIASMQPTHCTSDMRWVEARVGDDRAKGAYAWASLLKSGAIISAGSDFPVESVNPFLGFFAAVTRQNAGAMPAGGWRAEERMTRAEALRSMTLHAAYGSFQEHRVGSITPGKQADFIVIDRDVMTVEPIEILETKVLRTVIAGETVYRSHE